jgi:hypothetical protein
MLSLQLGDDMIAQCDIEQHKGIKDANQEANGKATSVAEP